MSTLQPESKQLKLHLIWKDTGCSPKDSGRGGEVRVAGYDSENSVIENSLMEEVVERKNLWKAFRQVKKNKGSPGIDGMTVEALSLYLKGQWSRIKEELLKGRYQPSPVLRVEIPKPDGGKRKLGIPTACVKCTYLQEPFGICENHTSFSCFSWTELSNLKNEEYFWYRNYFFETFNTGKLCCAL